MPELTYPLERAVAYAKRARSKIEQAPPASLVAFETLIARYREFVEVLDRVRREQEPRDARAALVAPLAAVESARDRVRETLRTEGRL